VLILSAPAAAPGGVTRAGGKRNMTGSPQAAIIIAIVSVISLAAWLAMVFYADAHPPRPESDTAAGRDGGDGTTGDAGRQQDDRPEAAPAHAPGARSRSAA